MGLRSEYRSSDGSGSSRVLSVISEVGSGLERPNQPGPASAPRRYVSMGSTGGRALSSAFTVASLSRLRPTAARS